VTAPITTANIPKTMLVMVSVDVCEMDKDMIALELARVVL